MHMTDEEIIYRWKNGARPPKELDCTDEEAAEFAKIKENEKDGTDEGKEKKKPEKPKKPEKAEVSPAGVPLKADMPAGVKNILLGWLRDKQEEYEDCVYVVKAYEQVLNYMKEAGEIVND